MQLYKSEKYINKVVPCILKPKCLAKDHSEGQSVRVATLKKIIQYLGHWSNDHMTQVICAQKM